MNDCSAMAVIVSLLACGGCHSTEYRREIEIDMVLRRQRLGTTLGEMRRLISDCRVIDQNAGSSLYPFWTVQVQSEDVSISMGLSDPSSKSSTINREYIDNMLYVGHFIMEGKCVKSSRWVYSDGLIFDDFALINDNNGGSP